MTTTNKSAALHTDSRISLDLLCNNPKHNALTENIKQELRKLEIKGWKIHFEWVKAHVGNEGNELADNLAKQATYCPELEDIYTLSPISTI